MRKRLRHMVEELDSQRIFGPYPHHDTATKLGVMFPRSPLTQLISVQAKKKLVVLRYN